eukprot:131719_1
MALSNIEIVQNHALAHGIPGDLVIYNLRLVEDGAVTVEDVYMDFTGVHPTCSTYVKGAANSAGHALELAERQKKSKYRGMKERLIIAAFETYGRIGVEFETVIKALADKISNQSGKRYEHVLNSIRVDLSCTIIKGNLRMINHSIRPDRGQIELNNDNDTEAAMIGWQRQNMVANGSVDTALNRDDGGGRGGVKRNIVTLNGSGGGRGDGMGIVTVNRSDGACIVDDIGIVTNNDDDDTFIVKLIGEEGGGRGGGNINGGIVSLNGDDSGCTVIFNGDDGRGGGGGRARNGVT